MKKSQLKKIITEMVKEDFNVLTKIEPTIIFQIYDILKSEYPQIEQDHTKSSFFHMINSKL